ncbi:MAG TPA: aminotransferase class I/II-fold pyridoxal phosphate-dependent enzyme [Clostridiaceae bacterium]|nr:aminotransferase class I/II-fold pyridoxal phosphate-dependent enzyme [Clostridiaceae bacterium]
MEEFEKMDVTQLKMLKEKLQIQYDDFKKQSLKLDMSRGKPNVDQLDLSMGIFECAGIECYRTLDGIDCRNYGELDGIPEAKKLFAEILEVSPDEIIVGGNASLNMMYDMVAHAMTHGVAGSEVPWGKLPKVKFLCPSPGYDRHFAICEFFNIEMITIPMKADGPDMDMVEKLAGEDEYIKGIWCVPKYSNPGGVTYSDEVVDRFAKMNTKATDFRIFWDNAYVVHHLYEEKQDSLKNILTACKQAGNPDRVFIFTSTSKITFPGAGVAVMAGSENNLKHTRKRLAKQNIGPDKLNQLRHVRFLKDLNNINLHMKKHAEIIRPKFKVVLDKLEKELGGKNIAWWSKPNGGYFISLNTMEGCAKKVVDKAAEAGVKLTSAGATFPYGKDPNDSNIRIAPSFPSLSELQKAIELVCICIQLVSVEKLLGE